MKKAVHEPSLRMQDLNLRPRGYEPRELPTAPIRVSNVKIKLRYEYNICCCGKIVLTSLIVLSVK